MDSPTMPAGRALLVIVGALLLGLVLNAGGILETAQRQTGATRTVAEAVMAPLAAATAAISLDTPHDWLDPLLDGPAPVASAPTTPPTVPEVVPTAPEVGTTTTTLPPAPTAADPLRLFVAGDSMVGQFGPMLENRAERTGVVDGDHFYEFSSGLTTPEVFDWGATLAGIEAEFDPDVWVVYLGGNDAREMDVDGTRVAYATGDGPWEDEYRERTRQLMAFLDSTGATTYWMGMPIVRSSVMQERYPHVNGIHEAVAAEFGSITYVRAWDWFAGPDGGYAEYLPDADGDLVDMRLDDGIHLTTAGAVLAADRLFPVIARDAGITETG